MIGNPNLIILRCTDNNTNPTDLHPMKACMKAEFLSKNRMTMRVKIIQFFVHSAYTMHA